MSQVCDKCGWAHEANKECMSKPHSRHQGLRYNEGKPRVDLIPAIVLLELGKHYTYGANKYHPNNWLKGFPYSETTASLLRHLYAWMAGERDDEESGHHHLVAVIWNAVALFYFELFPEIYKGFDDRVLPRTKSMAEIAPLPYNAWEELYMGKFESQEDAPYNQGPMGVPVPDSFFTPIPPTVPIPEDFFMLKTGERIDPEDYYYKVSSPEGQWTKVPRGWVGKPYDKSMGPIIHKSKAPYRSTQITIKANDPCSWCGTTTGEHTDHCTRGNNKWD